jgi:hypothetical protein
MARDPDQRYQTGRQVTKDLVRIHGELAAAAKSEQSATAQVAAVVAAEPAPAEMVPRERLLKRMFQPATMRGNWGWWFAASVMVALGGGAAYGWFQRAPDLRPTPKAQNVAAAAIPWEQMPQQPRAQDQYEYAVAVGQLTNAEAAWTAVIKYFPTEDDWARRARVQLGRHYLDEHELDKAERLFGEMAADLDPKNRLVADVGRAALLSMRDRPEESLNMLWDVVRGGEVGQDRVLVGMILWTLERNHRNLGKDPDPELRRWAAQKIDQLTPGPRPGADRNKPGG